MGEASVGELQARLGKPLPTISLHLHKLADRGILEARNVGNRVYFTLRSPQIRSLIEGIQAQFSQLSCHHFGISSHETNPAPGKVPDLRCRNRQERNHLPQRR